MNFGNQSLGYWPTGFPPIGVLVNRGYDAARIEIRAAHPGDLVTLQGFTLASWQNDLYPTSVRIYSAGGTSPIYSFDGIIGGGGTITTLTPNVSAVDGIWLEWDKTSRNVGVGRINYLVSSVPEMPTIAMLSLGLLGLAAKRFRLSMTSRRSPN
jgi:hypothetical protein